MKRISCPYCFNTIRTSEVAFRCINANPSVCPPESDEALAAYRLHKKTVRLGRVIHAHESGWREDAATCSCGSSSSRSICPFCHHDLPLLLADSTVFKIALFGTQRAGKSQFLAALVHALSHQLGAVLNASLTSLDNATHDRFTHGYGLRLVDNARWVPPTKSYRDHHPSRTPLVYRLILSLKTGKRRPLQRTIILSITDVPSADAADIDRLVGSFPHLGQVDSIFCFLDPLQIPAIRKTLDMPDSEMPPIEDPERLLLRFTRLLDLKPREGSNSRLTVPLAIILPKLDLVRDRFDPAVSARELGEHLLNRDDRDWISRIIQSNIGAWMGTNSLQFIRQRFEHHAFFALSATGYRPRELSRPSLGLQPFRVAEPLLWALEAAGKLNLIDVPVS